MRTRLRSKVTLLFMMFALLVAVPAVAVVADTINSDIVGVSGNNSGPYKAGDATGPSVDYWINQTGSDGCDALGGSGMSFTLKATHNVTGADLSEKVLAKGPTDSVAKPLKDASNPSNRFSLAFNQCGSSSSNFKTVAFTSTNDLAPGQIKIEVDTITDATTPASYTGSAQWFLNATDGLGPTVTEFAPTGTSVPVNTDVTAKFSEAMNDTTISNSTFTLSGPSGSVSGPVTYNGTTNTATLNPFGSTATNLDYNTEYTATVTTGAQDVAGNALDQDPGTTGNQSKTWTFTTEPPPNTAPVANAQSASTNEDNSTTITLSATDADGDDLTFEITDQPDNGQLGPIVPVGPTTATVNYTPNQNYNGSDSFKYRANDGTVNSDEATVSITVNPVNDEPSFTKGANVTVNEDSGAYSAAWATGISTGPADENGQTVSFHVSNNNNALFSTQPSVAPNGTLTFTPEANAFGTATVSVYAQDSGGTTNGGDDTTATQTFTITVNSVNDEPSFTKGADETVNEDAGAQTVNAWATDISAGPNESGQALNFIVTNDNSALFSNQPSVAPNGTLSYTPAADANGTATVSVTLKDDGGTANSGDDTSETQTFKITVTAVNDAPSFQLKADPDQTVLEDSGAQSVTGLVSTFSAGPANESSQVVDFVVSNNNNALFSVQPSIDGTGKLSYTPAADANGTATVTVKARDDGGTANGGVNESAEQTFTITVNAVNDAPSFTKGANQTVNEDAGAQSVPWATSISAGPNESQTVSFVVTSNSNPSLFSAAPSVAADGTLTYTPAANANGNATIKVKITDDGGTANGGVNESAEQTFTITVNAVNDAPSFTKGANQTVLENSGAHTVPGWATSISAGPANESGQAVDFIVSNDNTDLFSVQPAVSPTGTLTYTLAPNTIGTATVSVKIHDDGDTANGGVNESAVQTFTIDVNYNFDGFRSPVDNLPTWNTVKAGSSIPVKFSLSGFKGMNIFALNGVPVSAPSSAKINCDTGSADALEEVGTAGSSGLNYDSTIDQYNYLWKSDKAWGGTCRLLTVELTDGTIHQAKFKFTK